MIRQKVLLIHFRDTSDSFEEFHIYVVISFFHINIVYVMASHMHSAIWYRLHNSKNVKKTHEVVLLLVACNFTKSNTPSWVFFTFLKLNKWYQIAQNVSY